MMVSVCSWVGYEVLAGWAELRADYICQLLLDKCGVSFLKIQINEGAQKEVAKAVSLFYKTIRIF